MEALCTQDALSNCFIVDILFAGYYIPELADTIVKRNKEADPSLVIKLKGIMVS